MNHDELDELREYLKRPEPYFTPRQMLVSGMLELVDELDRLQEGLLGLLYEHHDPERYCNHITPSNIAELLKGK